MSESFAVLIPDGDVRVALHVMHCLAQRPEVKLHSLSARKWNPCRFSRHRGAYEVRPEIVDPDEYLEAVLDLARRSKVDVILPVSTIGIEFVSTHHQELSEIARISPVPDMEAFRIAGNKWSVTHLAEELDIPIPESILVTLDAAFYERLAEMEYPVLLKPARAQGGRGIHVFKTPADAQEFLETHDEEKLRDQYLIQGYVPGATMGLNVLCREGRILAYCMQQYLVAPGFTPPTAIQFIEREDMLESGRKLVSALNWSGVANIDWRYDERDGRAKLLEVNPRFWATLVGSLVVGVNFPFLSCLAALDIPFAMPEYELGKFVKVGVAVKEMLRRPLGRNTLDGFAFRETELKYVLTDPLPKLADYAADGLQSACNRWPSLRRSSGFMAEFLADWFPAQNHQV